MNISTEAAINDFSKHIENQVNTDQPQVVSLTVMGQTVTIPLDGEMYMLLDEQLSNVAAWLRRDL